MEETTNPISRDGWLQSSGIAYVLRIPRLAIRPASLALALAGIVLTLVYGTALDWVWSLRGGVSEGAVAQFIMACQLDQPTASTPVGSVGVFHAWCEHERRCVLGLLGSVVPFKSLAGGTSLGQYVESQARAAPLAYIVDIGYGFWWLVRQHTVFAFLLIAGLLLIWSWAGGGICRAAAVEFARGDRLTLQQAERFARERLWGGFALAPSIPLGMIVVLLVLLVLGGMFLWIPLLGDLLGGVLFILALFAGVLIAALLVGLVVAGHLYWPAVAADDTDGTDAFTRGCSFLFARPWRAVFYAVCSLVYSALCWIGASLFVFLALRITRSAVSFGTAPFGWGRRTYGEQSFSKLELLWPLPGPDALFFAPDWSRLGILEYAPAALIMGWVLLVVALLWSLLVTLYFSSCTVAYFLLRRDVDGTDLEDVSSDEIVESADRSGSTAGTPTPSA